MSRREPRGEPPPVGPAGPSPEEAAGRQSRKAARSLIVAVVGLAVVAAILGLYAYKIEDRAIDVERRLTELEALVEDRSAQRDDEAAEMREQFRVYLCEVLAQLPVDPARSRLWATLRCTGEAAGPPAAGETSPAVPPPDPGDDGGGASTPPAPAPLPPSQPAPPPPPPAPDPSLPPPDRPVEGLIYDLLPLC